MGGFSTHLSPANGELIERDQLPAYLEAAEQASCTIVVIEEGQLYKVTTTGLDHRGEDLQTTTFEGSVPQGSVYLQISNIGALHRQLDLDNA